MLLLIDIYYTYTYTNRKTNVRANRESSSVGETADLPTTANPAYEAVKQNQGDEDHYSYVTVN